MSHGEGLISFKYYAIEEEKNEISHPLPTGHSRFSVDDYCDQ